MALRRTVSEWHTGYPDQLADVLRRDAQARALLTRWAQSHCTITAMLHLDSGFTMAIQGTVVQFAEGQFCFAGTGTNIFFNLDEAEVGIGEGTLTLSDKLVLVEQV